MTSTAPELRSAELADVDALLRIECECFSSDRLSKRSFRHWIQAQHGIFVVAEIGEHIIGYGLVWCHRGTRLARIYSLAVSPTMRGQGVAVLLLNKLEAITAARGHLFMRLEVSKQNHSAITLYQHRGYRIFGEYSDYYDDHSDALRMQKNIVRVRSEQIQRLTPWYQQTTEFTCGPAALLMAMASLNADLHFSQALELDLWREATTIYMTSGHGGCHPIGLALAASHRGFVAEVYINSRQTLFIESVRSAHKKAILTLVHQQFCTRASEQGIAVHYADITQQQIVAWLADGLAIVMLISTYRLDGKKVPHWVTITAADERCFYVHDPDMDDSWQLAIDCQHLPIARDDFDRMSAFGASRLRTAILIRQRPTS